MNKKFIAKLLALAMVLSMVPVAFAASWVERVPNGDGTYIYIYHESNDTNSNIGGKPSTPAAEDITTLPDKPTTEITEITVEGDKAILEVRVVDGVAYAVVTEEALDVEVKGDTLTLVVKADGADKVYVDLPGAALVKLGKAVTMESDIATITIPATAMTGALKDAKTVTIAAAVSESGSYAIAVMADGKAVTKDIKGLSVVF